jgi:hypothetical protein
MSGLFVCPRVYVFCRRKALLALSCLTRHSDPAMEAFRASGGLELLLRAAKDEDARQQRCAAGVCLG